MTNFNNCHLWQTDNIAEDELLKLEVMETFIDESHFIRRLKRCNDCGQLYFYQFLEEIDWEKGDDPNWRILIPVNSREEALKLLEENELSVLSCRPRIQWSWTSTKEAPHWMR